MTKGLYTAYTGMINQMNRMDVLTNNLANSATNGFKKEGSTSQAFNEVLAIKLKDSSEYGIPRGLGGASLGVKIGETYTDYAQGPFRVTDNKYDMALDGDGFFAISFTNKAGVSSIKYTRDGAFTLTKEGYLVTKDGDFVLSKDAALASTNQVAGGIPTGAIQINPLLDFKVDEDGRVYQNNEEIAQLGVVDVEDYNYIRKYGENMYDLQPGGTIIDSGARVRQETLEMSNVNVVYEMVEMITTTRAYETNQKVIQAIDDSLGKAVNDVGRV
ncbi:MAG: flagellar hook-basal body protein [Lachnospiraceae bacterium]|nr:flagellar hook-basal body protein [Lachnospiraceae bacterium]